MRLLLVSLLLACAGPGQKALSQTPTATTKRTPAAAPAASGSDQDRQRLIQTNDDMQDAQNAHREAAGGTAETPRRPLAPAPPDGAQPKTEPVSPDRQ